MIAQTFRQWKPVTRQHPCQICGKPDWCKVTDDGVIAICWRVADGAKKHTKAGGHVHILRESTTWRRACTRVVTIPPAVVPAAEFASMAARWKEVLTPDQLAWLSNDLRVPESSLKAFSVGWSRIHQSFSFPMVDASGRVTGIRLRHPDGQKFSVRGGHEGIFYASDWCPREGETIFIVEGASDAIALHSIGIKAVIGRPSCSGGVSIITSLVREHRPKHIIIIADNDTPGFAGAERLAQNLMAYCCDVRIITPPTGIKDARAWVNAGATADTIHAAVDAAPRKNITIQIRTIL